MSAHELKQKYPDIFLGRNVIRICRICEVCVGIDQTPLLQKGWDVSHGLCDRHLVQTLRTAKIPQSEVYFLMTKAIQTRHSKGVFVTRDLEHKASTELINWLKSPTDYYK